jgi:anti-sigma factor NepR-like protein
MSEEKNASLGKAYQANAAQDAKQAAPPPQGAAVAASEPMSEPDDVADDPRRDRNQQVLPGILGKQLRAAYGELLNAPVPDAIADLIKRLEHAQPGKPATKAPADKGGSK